MKDIKKLSEPQNLIKPAQNIMPLYEDNELDEQLAESEKQWVDEMIKRNLSVDEFNQEFNQEDWSLSISEGSYMMKNDDKGNQEEYSGTVLELNNRQKQ